MTIENHGQPTAIPATTKAILKEGTTRDRGLTITLSVEGLLWVVMTIAAVVSRLWELGARVMSHDESLHVFYSWQLATGNGFAHNPMMHGPFLFEATALINAILGASDFTSRLVPAILGTLVVTGVPLLLRPWLGRLGALAASVALLISPYVLYYSRYNRHDLQVIAWALLAFFALLAYLDRRQEKYLVLLAAALALMFATMEITFFYLAIFAGFLLLKIFASYRLNWPSIRRSAEFDLLIVLATLGAFFSSPIALLALNPVWIKISGQPFVDLKTLDTFGAGWAATPAGPRLWGLLALFAAGAAAVGLWWGGRRWLRLAGVFLAITIPLFTTFFTNLPGIATGFVGSLGYWLSQQEVARGSQPWYCYLVVFPIYEYLPILGGLLGGLWFALKGKTLPQGARVFCAFVLWWALWIFFGLTLAGEKMPWLSVHITIPFILLTAWGIGQIFTHPEGKQSKLSGLRLRWAAGALLVVLGLSTLRTSFLVNYVNYDYTTEFIGYAHGAPGVKWALADVQAIAARSGLGKTLKVASDDEIAWPMSWYLRDYPGFFGAAISRQAVADAGVVIAGPKNWKKADLYLQQGYRRYEVIRMWWPVEDYKNLTWPPVRDALANPEMRTALWDIFWRRDYTRYTGLTGQAMDPPWKWPLEDRMRVYIREDLAAQITDLRLAASQLPDLPPAVDTYAGVKVQAGPLQVIANAGLNAPRNLAVAADGSVYVVDTGNSRIVRLDPSGEVLAAWGSRTPEGQVPPQAGTFNEPWGIALDARENVYVADTWNHRIQKFTSDGRFLLEWGAAGNGEETPALFWGPRGVAVGPDGRVYVTDTGNKRVAVFDPDGKYLFDFEKEGEAALDEPVGLAISTDEVVFVADTWNMRVASFDLEGKFLTGWPVEGWNSDSVDNKPYLAVDAAGRVLLTDPEGYRMLAFSTEGTPLAALGQFGEEEDAFDLPTGIATGPDGSVWLADAGNNRLVRYADLLP